MSTGIVGYLFAREMLKYQEKGDVQFTAKLSAIAKYMRKHRKDIDFDPNNVWQLAYERNRAKLSLMLLLYLYVNNEGRLSDEEEKQLKKTIKRERIFLQQDDFSFLHDLSTKKPTLLTFTEYLQTNKLKQDIFDAAVKAIHKNIEQKPIYKTLLDKLKENIKDVIAIKK